jgi:hypothetical protein
MQITNEFTVGAEPQVVYETLLEFELTGRAAQMGGGIVEDVARRLVADMATNLRKLLEPSSPSPAAPATTRTAASGPANRPISGSRLLLRALWHRLSRSRRQSLSETH